MIWIVLINMIVNYILIGYLFIYMDRRLLKKDDQIQITIEERLDNPVHNALKEICLN